MALRIPLLLAAALTTAAALAPAVAADEIVRPDRVPAADRQCDAGQRAASLAADQRRVLDRLGSLRVLNGPQDVVALAALGGWGPDSHGWVQYRGVGVGLLNLPRSLDIIAKQIDGVTAGTITRDAVTSGQPTGLFYRSLNPAAVHDDPYTPSFPYELVGWFYGAVYTPGLTPIEHGLCVYPTDWGFHERGVHAFPTFDMVTQPCGRGLGGAGAGQHPRGAAEPARPGASAGLGPACVAGARQRHPDHGGGEHRAGRRRPRRRHPRLVPVPGRTDLGGPRSARAPWPSLTAAGTWTPPC